MKIGIEAERANNPQKTGVEHYAKQLILHLAKIDRTNEYILYLRTKPENWFFELPANFKVKVMPFPIFWTQIRLSWEMLTNPVDVLFIPASALPLIHPKNSVITIHDLGWKYYPETFTVFMRNFLRWSTWYAVTRAKKIIAVSNATKKDILDHYKVDDSKVVVVHHGYEQADIDSMVLSEEVRSRLPERFILFLSTIQPRKNLPSLIKAFVKLQEENPQIPHKLVVVGRPGWKYESTLQLIEQHKDQVVYLNHVSDSDRWGILVRASLLVLPSFYEGFGMQILEAFQANVPVATSNISSMPEVAGDAAVYFDPKKIEEIKLVIEKVLQNQELAGQLVKKGRERLNDFSWLKCAKQTLAVLESVRKS